MKISGVIRDEIAMFTLPSIANRVSTGAYVFTMRGLPIAWDEKLLKKLLLAWSRKQGFTALTVSATSTTVSKWNARVQFFAPLKPFKSAKRTKTTAKAST